MEANIGHLPTKFGYKTDAGLESYQPFRVLRVNLHIWPHMTFDLLMWPLTPAYHGGQYRASTVTNRCRVGKLFKFLLASRTDGRRTDGGQTDGRNLDPLVSLHLGGARQKWSEGRWQPHGCYRFYMAITGSTGLLQGLCGCYGVNLAVEGCYINPVIAKYVDPVSACHKMAMSHSILQKSSYVAFMGRLYVKVWPWH